jgi:hypothetical protein
VHRFSCRSPVHSWFFTQPEIRPRASDLASPAHRFLGGLPRIFFYSVLVWLQWLFSDWNRFSPLCSGSHVHPVSTACATFLLVCLPLKSGAKACSCAESFSWSVPSVSSSRTGACRLCVRSSIRASHFQLSQLPSSSWPARLLLGPCLWCSFGVDWAHNRIGAQASIFPSPNLILIVLWYACGLLQVIPGIVLESPDQKTRGFLVQIVLPRWIPECAH